MKTTATTPQGRYVAAHCVNLGFKLNREYDADVLEWLAQKKNKQGAVKALIRAEICREKAESGNILACATVPPKNAKN